MESRLRLPSALFWALLLAACSKEPPPRSAPQPLEPLVLTRPKGVHDGSLPLAAIFPAAGRYELSGTQSLNGTRLAVDDVNREGGVHGRRISLLEYKTGSYFLDARLAARLAAQSGALAILGSNASDLSMAIAEEAESKGLVQVSNVSTAQALTADPRTGRQRSFVFRVCSTDATMGTLLATFAREDLGARRAAVLYEVGRAYSSRLAQSFVRSFSDPPSGRVASEFFYLALETDFRDRLREVKKFKPDVLFLPGSFTDATLIARQAGSLGLEATLLGADGWSNRSLFKRGAPERPAFFADHCSSIPAFDERYLKTFGEETQGCRAALAYDAVRTVVEALRALPPLSDNDLGEHLLETRLRLKASLREVDTEGVTGRIRFAPTGDRRIGIVVMEARPPGQGRGGNVVRARLGDR